MGIFIAAISLFLFIFLISPFVPSAESAGQDKSDEVIFLLDTSNSMNDTDRVHLALDAVKQMLYSLPTNYDVGFIAYGDDLQTVCALGEKREQLRMAIDQVTYTGYTNAGAGLEKAIQSFSAGQETTKTVILLSDGEIALDGEQATQESVRRFNKAMQEAANQGVRIIVVGLGNRSTVPQANIYNAGNGGAKMYEASTMEQLPDIAKKIVFEDLGVRKTSVSVGEVKGGNLKVKLPTVNLTSAAILITSGTRLENLAANYNAEGAEITSGERFAVVRIDRPSATGHGDLL